jgi:hypothetical protein
MNIKLIALVVLAIGAVPGIEVELAIGAEFETTPEVAEKLLTDGQAKLASAPPSAAPPQKERLMKARVLQQCTHGAPNDVIELPTSEAKAAEKQGLVDCEKASVAYALGLPQNQPKAD